MQPLKLLMLFCALLPTACSEGGKTKTSDVTLALELHGVGFGGNYQLRNWPLKASDINDDFFTIDMRKDGSYVVKRVGSKDSSPLPYFLDEDGAMGLRISTKRSPSQIVWRGSLAISNPGKEYFFLRRDQFPSFYCGMKKLGGEPALADSWWVFGSELHYGNKNKTPSHDTIGRAFAGELSFDSKLKVSSGSWTDSSSKTGLQVLAAGQAKSFEDGEVQLTLALTGGAATGPRSFSGAVGKHFGALVSRNTSEPSQSLMLMLRKHSAAWKLSDFAGEWHVATQSIFNNPKQNASKALSSAGLDAALGSMKIEADGDVQITVRGISGRRFRYLGKIKVAKNGAFELEVKGQPRRWRGAMDPEKKIILFSDNVTRASLQSLDWEVGTWMAVPVQVPTSK
ncbi:MAG: hypothetical protein CSA62_04795 [Planctomycetota bacterium]|nr:MAG: hypothetical protein CSA62_04795 [Planctomycetota bacterium]